MNTAGFVYVATGDQYREEAVRSARSLKQHNPEHPVCLISDRPETTGPWNEVVILPQPQFGFRDKMEMQRSPYDRTVFLDTDTTIFGPIGELFEILERFDVCGVQMCEGQDYVMPGIPHAYPEMNSGVIGFRKNAATAVFFEAWARYYQTFREENRAGHYHYANVGDQKSLRAALWHSQARIAQIGAEYNFIPFKMEFASLPVKVVHTRQTDGLGPLVERLNAQLGRRAYVPVFNAVVADVQAGPEFRRLLSAVLRQGARHFARALFPPGLREALRRSPRLRRLFLGNLFESDPASTDYKWEKKDHGPR